MGWNSHSRSLLERICARHQFGTRRFLPQFPSALLHGTRGIASNLGAHHLTPGFDFRSDTVTKPTPEMLQYMVQAECGDDVFQEDPTVRALERRVAALFGRPAALFVASGTLSNQLAVRVHLTCPPYAVLCDARAHVYVAESGGLSFHSGAHVVPLHTPLLPYLQSWHPTEHDWEAPLRLVCLENTLCGELVPLRTLHDIHAVAKSKGLRVHLDGARIWNAAVASETQLHAYGAVCDSISVCFSKGLGAPVGSCLVGSEAFIRKARHFRKLFGGGMRQAGFLAAACLYALDHHYPHSISTAHQHAQTLFDALEARGLAWATRPETNMLFLDVRKLGVSLDTVTRTCLEHGVRVEAYDADQLRLVTHAQLAPEALDRLVEAFAVLLKRN